MYNPAKHIISLVVLLQVFNSQIKSSYIMTVPDLKSDQKNILTEGVVDNVQILNGEMIKDENEQVEIVTFNNKHKMGCTKYPKSKPIIFYLY